MLTLAIDPGPTECGLCILKEQKPVAFANFPVDVVLEDLRGNGEGFCALAEACVIEEYKPFGRVLPGGKAAAVSPQSADVLRFIGRVEELCHQRGLPVTFVSRLEVVKYITGSGSRAKSDTRVREALIRNFGGKGKAVGTKKSPGLLYGCSKHAWAAFAVGYTANRYEVPF